MMKRRAFVKLGILSAGAMTLPLLHCRSNDQYNILLHQPTFLSQICDEKALREIGLEYRKLKPGEENASKLIDLLTRGASGKKLDSKSSDKEVETFIKNEIHTDFDRNDIIAVKGWVLSFTEARQCALFSHTPL